MDSSANDSATTPQGPGSSKSPWSFVPSLYFMQGIPVVVVQQLSVTMYKSMGVDNARIGLWTSLISWPWIVKMLWGPMVDGTSTKRNWVVWTQAILIALLGISALGIQQTNFLAVTLGIFFLVAFVSATHDIAADGFYLLSLPESAQAFFVGIRSAFFRLATIFCTGGLVVLAGKLSADGGNPANAWTVALLVGTGVYGLAYLWGLRAYPRPVTDAPREPFKLGIVAKSFGQIMLMLVAIFMLGRLLKIASIEVTNLIKPASAVSPVVKASFQLEESAPPIEGEKAGPKGERLLDQEIPATPELDAQIGSGQYQVPVPEGAKLLKSERTGQNYATPFFLPTSNLQTFGSGIESFAAAATVAYPVQLLLNLSVIVFAFFSTRSLFRRIGMGEAAREYFSQNRIMAVLGFILFYRFGESMIGKLSSPFLLDPREKGGLGVSLDQVGMITGTVGVIALTLGGLVGGVLISRYGIKKCIWPMVLALNIPNLFYVWAAYNGPGLGAVTGLIAIDQFGYGFGFSAYMVYLMFLSQGVKNQTSHYAISTGLMALGAMFAGIASGYLQTWFAGSDPATSYARFFVAVCVCTIPGMLMLFFIPMDKEDLKVAPVDLD